MVCETNGYVQSPDFSTATVFPRIDARAFIFFVTPRTRRLNSNGAGVYLLHIFLAHAHPCYVAHAEVEIHFSSEFVPPYGKPRERQAHSIAFNLKDASKHHFCALEVAVGEVQLAPFSLPRGTCHAPNLVPAGANFFWTYFRLSLRVQHVLRMRSSGG